MTPTARRATASANRGAWDAIRDFTGPGRRRTDHPLVVGTILLCLGLITVGQIVGIAAVFWAGSQVKILLDGQRQRDKQTETMRTSIIRHAEAQALVLRRVCLNVSRTEEDRIECLAVAPSISPEPPRKLPR